MSEKPGDYGLINYYIDYDYTLSRAWKFRTSEAPRNKNIIKSDSTDTILMIDNDGYLNFIDALTGSLVNSQYIGVLIDPNLNIAKDYDGGTLFIALADPSKIIAYSVERKLKDKKR